ncbi:MAG: permease [Candidatus Nomurabacteria bacterium]|nr:permease [Candidatus Nomurabacteria bacterium]
MIHISPFVLFVTLTALSTFIGGIVAFKLKTRLNLLLGFTAGVILSVVAFDLLPEISNLATSLNISLQNAFVPLVIGFLIFHVIEKYIQIHIACEDNYGHHRHPTLGVGSALALIGHSLLDGIGIGLAFHISNTTGIAVAFAVLAHDFSDGINTVSLMLSHKNTRAKAFGFLILDSLAPIIGAVSTLFFTLPDKYGIIYLGLFAGFLLYISTSDILPEAHSEKSSWVTVFMTVFGAGIMYFILQFITL